ncbi:hypothetical protein EQG49_09405 [Periweissella cryptocerci]|uniref:Uncharacterized protein n=1 Tax=Periweissella cryptocerci TaxID=2506420 RepID=A0A4P6YV56_9LACO|nr:hypothetical protein [Periweissella cryptocerci]QBO36660.1 hypothetical protein EQG49_09405 [Periweissella cryptocerci]
MNEENDKREEDAENLVIGSGKRMMSKEFTLFDQESHTHKNLTPQNFPGILHEPEPEEKIKQRQLNARKAHRRQVIITTLLASLVVIVIIAVGLWFYIGMVDKQNSAREAKQHSTAQSISAKSTTQVDKLNVKPTDYKWGATVKQISPTDYLANVYGKQKQFFLVLGASSDAKLASLAKQTDTNVSEFGINTPIYFIDAAKYYYNGDKTDNKNYQQILTSMGLISQANTDTKSENQDFKSTLFASKLVKQDNKAAYSSYKADASMWGKSAELHAWLAQVTPQLLK